MPTNTAAADLKSAPLPAKIASPCEVRDTPMGAALFATCRIPFGTRVLSIEGRLQSHPTRYSIQLDVGTHIEADGDLPDGEMRRRHPWRFLNHSCDPNARVEGRMLVALRPIAEGEQITFDYTTTESSMAEPFDCMCGSKECLGTVRGYAHLDEPARRARAGRLAPHLCADAGDLVGGTA